MVTKLLSRRLDSSVITRGKHTEAEMRRARRKPRQKAKSGKKEFIEKRNKSKSGVGGRSQTCKCGASLERKQLYLHEAYLGSRPQNNGRKRAHGTFPFQRACVPLSRVSWPRAALRSTETSPLAVCEWPRSRRWRPARPRRQG